MRYDDPTAPRVAPQVTHTIIEKGMSPAEAAKLLAEFEKAARDKIISVVHVENQLLNGSLLIEREEALGCNRLVMKMQLNGHERLFELVIPDWTSHESSAEKLNKLRIALANHMVEALLDELTNPIIAAIQPRTLRS